MPIPYLDLKIGAKARLAKLRASGVSFPNSGGWRKARFSTFLTEDSGLSSGYRVENAGSQYEKRVPISYAFEQQFRSERWADEVCRSINHTGWYASSDQDNKIRGFIARLPHGRFLAGYEDTLGGGRTYLHEFFDDEQDAARRADQAALRVAEAEREYCERRRAAQDLAEEAKELGERIRELWLLRNRKELTNVRARLHKKIEVLRAKRETLATTYKDIEL